MPFPDIDGFTFADDQATVAAWLDRVAPARPPAVAAAFARLYQRVDIVSTKLYNDVQGLKERIEILAALLADLPPFISGDLDQSYAGGGVPGAFTRMGESSAAALEPRYPFKGHAEAAASEREAPTIDTGGFSYGPDNPSGPAPTIDTGGFTIGPVDPAEEPSI